MRLARSSVGWLCAASLLTTFVLGAKWLHLKAFPFFHGAAIYYYPVYSWGGQPKLLIQQLASSGLREPVNPLLKRFATEDMKPQVQTGWAAAMNQILDPRPEVSKAPPMVSVAVVDEKGSVIAAYPTSLAGELPVLTRWEHQRWASAFREASAHYLGNGGNANLYDITGSNGRVIGTLAVTSSHTPSVAVIPASARPSRSLFSPLTYAIGAIVAFLAYWVLLSVWVAMDAGWRGMRPFAWGSLVMLTNWLGLFAYLMARLSPPKPCPNCAEEVLAKYKRCPACGITLLSRCPACGARLKPGWQYCPVCSGIGEPALKESADEAGLYEAAVRLVRSRGTASTSLIQRELRIGYTKAVRIIDKMKQDGIIDSLTTRVPAGPGAGGASPGITELADERASFRISVTEADSHKPVSGARVRVSGPSAVDGLTNQEGVFEARRLSLGNHEVSVERSGFASARTETEITDSAVPSSLSIALTALPGSISGRVVERTSRKPLEGANVYLDSERLERSDTTDASGGFKLADVPAGPYTVRVEADPAVSQVKLVQVPPGRDVRADLTIEFTAETVTDEQPSLKE